MKASNDSREFVDKEYLLKALGLSPTSHPSNDHLWKYHKIKVYKFNGKQVFLKRDIDRAVKRKSKKETWQNNAVTSPIPFPDDIPSRAILNEMSVSLAILRGQVAQVLNYLGLVTPDQQTHGENGTTTPLDPGQ